MRVIVAFCLALTIAWAAGKVAESGPIHFGQECTFDFTIEHKSGEVQRFTTEKPIRVTAMQAEMLNAVLDCRGPYTHPGSWVTCEGRSYTVVCFRSPRPEPEPQREEI